MRAPVNRLRKDEIVWLAKHRCRHRHTFLEHFSCYLQERPQDGPPIEEKIGFFDIEASNLHATFGYMFSYAIKELDKDIIGRVLTTAEIQGFLFDRELVSELIDNIMSFDRLVVYWGKDRRMDLPFIRTRAVLYGYDFPKFKELYITDCYDIMKAKFRLHANRLENGCSFFGIPCKQHKLDPLRWQRAMAGDPDSLDFIWEHNKEDVVSLEGLWKKVYQFGSNAKTSI